MDKAEDVGAKCNNATHTIVSMAHFHIQTYTDWHIPQNAPTLINKDSKSTSATFFCLNFWGHFKIR